MYTQTDRQILKHRTINSYVTRNKTCKSIKQSSEKRASHFAPSSTDFLLKVPANFSPSEAWHYPPFAILINRSTIRSTSGALETTSRHVSTTYSLATLSISLIGIAVTSLQHSKFFTLGIEGYKARAALMNNPAHNSCGSNTHRKCLLRFGLFRKDLHTLCTRISVHGTMEKGRWVWEMR